MLDELKQKFTVTNYAGFCVYLQGYDVHMLTEKDVPMLEVFKMMRSIPTPSVFYVLTLPQSSTTELKNNNDVFMKMMKASKEKQGSSLYSFSNKINDGYDAVKQELMQLFVEDKLVGCDTSKEAEQMNSLLFVTSKTIFYLDGHVPKMRRHNGFVVPELFQELIGETEGSRVFKKNNKQLLGDIKTSYSEQLSDGIMQRIQHITSPSIKKSSTFQAINNVRISLDNYIIGVHKHNCRQQFIKSRHDNSGTNDTSTCAAIPHRKLITISILNPLVLAAKDLEEMKLLNVRTYEEEYIKSSFVNQDTITDSLINLQRYQKRKLR